ncbi:lipocalin-like domain-containing protein [Seonamhaeicola sp. ML3]|uniref:lipocalin-like domain-containing protein n=1 Tax=Seonamhaeicola sp. ML3 TaxID=2937786 RepID=UPI00200F11F9|nr:lipocalin-like domain-containing protein [Seonamhaeicola sp. ML3]
MKLKITLSVLIFFVCITTYSQDWKTYPYVPSGGSLVSFPVDEGRHSAETTEWWYVSGHITTDTNKKYSFMLTYFFRPTSISIFNFDGFRILNVTDESDGTFYQDTKALNYATLSETELNIVASLFPTGTEYWRNKEDSGGQILPFEYEISASSTDISMDFNLETVKRPLIVGGDGLFDQGDSSYTYYYSQTENTVTGSLRVGSVTENVTGEAWIDRQYGSFNPFTGEDYEWFSIKLDNGTDINLWNIFNSSRSIPENSKFRILSAYVDESESSQYTISDFEIERLEYFFTPDNLRCYSKKWRLTSSSKNIDLIITINHENSEVDISELSFKFFEGATTITGTINSTPVTGVGFTELLHTYENPSLSIISPNGGVYDTSNNISWQVNNPDDGRPLKYDLEYSIDNQATFIPIASGLTDTFFSWNGAGTNNADTIWFRVKGYSLDNTLSGEVISTASSSVTLSNFILNKDLFSVHPNPAKDNLFIEFGENISGKIEILDVNGRSISNFYTNAKRNHNLNLETLSNGLYFLSLVSNKGKQVIKFVKDK